jgi:hypothetical protein
VERCRGTRKTRGVATPLGLASEATLQGAAPIRVNPCSSAVVVFPLRLRVFA